MSVIESLIETQEFATLPPVAAKVLTILQDDDSNIRDIAKIIETDASLTLKLLRVANSPLYATRSEISSIQQAIVTLGLNRLTNIVLGVSIFSKFLMSSHSNIGNMMQKFWWHSSCTGMVAKALSNKIKRQYKENEFIGGLIHDIGKLAMLQYDSSKYLKVVELINSGRSDTDSETEIFGANHIQVGSEIAKLWKLPEEMTTIISSHNNPESAGKHRELVAVVRFADILCEIWGADFFEGLHSIELDKEEAWKVLITLIPELKNVDVEIFTFELEEEYKKSSDFLNIMMKS